MHTVNINTIKILLSDDYSDVTKSNSIFSEFCTSTLIGDPDKVYLDGIDIIKKTVWFFALLFICRESKDGFEDTGLGGVVLNINNQILIVNQNHDSWSLPKGHIDDGETKLEAAIREIYEETGIEKPK